MYNNITLELYTIVTKIQISLCTLIWDPNTHHTYLVMEERQDTAKVSNTVAKGAKRTTKVKQNAYGKREYKKIYLKKTHVQSKHTVQKYDIIQSRQNKRSLQKAYPTTKTAV